MAVVAKTPDAAEELAAVEEKAIQKYIIPASAPRQQYVGDRCSRIV